MYKEKGLAPILIVLLIALAIGGYFLYQKQLKPAAVVQSSPTPVVSPKASSSIETANPDSIGANWKTYTSKLGGYSIKHPSNWIYKEDASPYYGSNIPSLTIYTDSRGANQQMIQINVINKAAPQETGMLKYKSTETLKYTNIIIGGYPARKVHMIGNCADGDQVIYIERPTNIYEIEWVSCRGKSVTNAIFDQILSTFKFTQ